MVEWTRSFENASLLEMRQGLKVVDFERIALVLTAALVVVILVAVSYLLLHKPGTAPPDIDAASILGGVAASTPGITDLP